MTTPAPHPYAEILRAIADGKEVQWQNSSGVWLDQPENDTLNEITVATYAPARYRVAPEMITIGDRQVPAPIRQAPAMGSTYWALGLGPTINNDATWSDDDFDRELLLAGRVFLCQADARAVSEAIKALLTGAST